MGTVKFVRTKEVLKKLLRDQEKILTDTEERSAQFLNCDTNTSNSHMCLMDYLKREIRSTQEALEEVELASNRSKEEPNPIFRISSYPMYLSWGGGIAYVLEVKVKGWFFYRWKELATSESLVELDEIKENIKTRGIHY